MKFILPTVAIAISLASCGEPAPVTKEQAAFDNANKQIMTGNDGTSYGASEEAKTLAANFSSQMKKMDQEFFSGGKKPGALSATKGEFLTYCKLHENSVVFLVHVPQFKRYKGEVRDSLNTLAWTVANQVAADYKPSEEVEIVVALKGSVLYGASAIGTRGATPVTENEYSIDTDKFHKYFLQ